MRFVILFVAAISVAGCFGNLDTPDTTMYEVTRYVGDIPVERWVCDDIWQDNAGTTSIYYNGFIKDVGDNVRIKKIESTQPETYTILVK